jgi:hypothetical protein
MESPPPGADPPPTADPVASPSTFPPLEEAPAQPSRRARNQRRAPKWVPCGISNYTVSLLVDDIAALGIVGHSSAPETATPLEHYRSAVADLNRQVIDELTRQHGAGIIRCRPGDCAADQRCGMRVVAIHPSTPDGYVDGTPLPELPGLPRCWVPSSDFKTCRFRDVTSPDAPLRLLWLTVDCAGCSRER